MDAENTTIRAGGSDAHRPDSRFHPSRDRLKAFAAGISPYLTGGEHIAGETPYPCPSVADRLPSNVLGFVWIVGDKVQSWDLTQAHAAELGIAPASTLSRGPYRSGWFGDPAQTLDLTRHEGLWQEPPLRPPA